MKIDRTMDFGEKPLRIFDVVSNGKTQLVTRSVGGAWSQTWGSPLKDPPASRDLSEDDIYGILEFDMVYGSFEDMTMKEQIVSKFKEFWYNAKDDRYFKQFVYPLLEANPALKQFVAKEAKATRYLPKVSEYNPTGRLKVRDPESDAFATRLWKNRTKDSIEKAIFDALTSQRAIKNLPDPRVETKGKAKLQIAMKLNQDSKPTFGGVTVHSANTMGKQIKTVLKNNGVAFYRAFIVPHLSIFQNRMVDILGEYNVYPASGGIVIPPEVLAAMFRNASAETPLREKVIRLAHKKPELRKHLLPLLKSAASTPEIVITQKGKGTIVKKEIGGTGSLKEGLALAKAELKRLGVSEMKAGMSSFGSKGLAVQTFMDTYPPNYSLSISYSGRGVSQKALTNWSKSL